MLLVYVYAVASIEELLYCSRPLKARQCAVVDVIQILADDQQTFEPVFTKTNSEPVDTLVLCLLIPEEFTPKNPM